MYVGMQGFRAGYFSRCLGDAVFDPHVDGHDVGGLLCDVDCTFSEYARRVGVEQAQRQEIEDERRVGESARRRTRVPWP